MNPPPKQPIAHSLDDIPRSGGIAAVFRAGTNSNDHRWELHSASGEMLAVTNRVHNGGRIARAYWKLVSATGMDAGNDIHLELLGAEGRVLARISSTNDAPAAVTIADDAGRLVARSVREKTALLRVKHPDGMTVSDAGEQPCARIDFEGDSPWPMRDGAGSIVGELLAGAPGPSLAPRWFTWIDPQWALSEATYNRGQHLGIRRVTQYSVAASTHSPPSLALSLVPLIAGLSY